MAQKFMPLFADMEELTEELTDRERGQLLRAMFAYFFRGEEERPQGNARFVWPAVRRTLDQCMEKADSDRTNGAKGGRPRKKCESAGEKTAQGDEQLVKTRKNPEGTESSPSEPQTKPPVAETKPPVAEEKPPVDETKPPIAKTKPPAAEKNPKQEQEQEQEQKQEHEQEQKQQQEQEHEHARTRPGDLTPRDGLAPRDAHGEPPSADASPAASPAAAEEVFFSCAEDDAQQPAARERRDRPDSRESVAPAVGAGGQPVEGPADAQQPAALIRRYGLPEGPVSLRALGEDIAAHGLSAVERALDEAGASNSRPMLSVNFYRAVLKNQLAQANSREGAGRGGGGGSAEYGSGPAKCGGSTAKCGGGTAKYGTGTAKCGGGTAKCGSGPAAMLRYTPQERRETYSAAIVDLDAEE